MNPKPPPRVLAIAGSDSSGGAGIQADIKTITMLGGYAMTAVTAVTAQNSMGVQAIAPISGDVVRQQIEACASDIGLDAIKIGMLHDADIIGVVAGTLSAIPEKERPPTVLDPVMIATSGAALIDPAAIAALKEHMFPFATLLTPNLPELEYLAGRTLTNTEQIEDAANELIDTFGCSVLAKGGHTDDDQIIDLLVQPGTTTQYFSHDRIDTRHTHGTGCTLSSAIATLLGHGQPLAHSVRLGREFVRRAIEVAPGFGQGHGPLGHQGVRFG